MKIGDTVWELIIGAIILAILFMLARPKSPGAQAIADVSNALASLISTATAYNASKTS